MANKRERPEEFLDFGGFTHEEFRPAKRRCIQGIDDGGDVAAEEDADVEEEEEVEDGEEEVEADGEEEEEVEDGGEEEEEADGEEEDEAAQAQAQGGDEAAQAQAQGGDEAAQAQAQAVGEEEVKTFRKVIDYETVVFLKDEAEEFPRGYFTITQLNTDHEYLVKLESRRTLRQPHEIAYEMVGQGWENFLQQNHLEDGATLEFSIQAHTYRVSQIFEF